jgi:hypothetical protein
MKPSARTLAFVLLLFAAAHVSASGPLGIYGIVEKVVFEPNEASPERIQLWGAFAYFDGATDTRTTISPVGRGYLYFRLPVAPGGGVDSALSPTVLREWADLKSVAGTGQAVGFGTWGYIGGFWELRPDTANRMPPQILERNAGRNITTDLRVRPASEPPAAPAIYQTNIGVVKIPAQGSHARVVEQLRAALKR